METKGSVHINARIGKMVKTMDMQMNMFEEKSVSTLVKDIKEANQDFEWYPTTDEIIKHVARHMEVYHCSKKSFLDIGAGNGKVLKGVKKVNSSCKLFAIEKSIPLIRQLPDYAVFIGSDFMEQTLFDKNIDVTFCNPPYSEFEQWSDKIIRETTSETVFLVIPTRWKESEIISGAIQYRNATVYTHGTFNFLNAERSARAVVNLLSISFKKGSNPFKDLFDKEYEEFNLKFEDEEPEVHKFAELSTGKDYVYRLVSMYKDELKSIKGNYDAVTKIDVYVLKEFGITPSAVLGLLQERLKTLKEKYWKQVLSNTETITKKLTSKKRQMLMNEINSRGNVDFTESNVYGVIIWILKKAESLQSEQIIETYEHLMNSSNTINYKSNKMVYSKDEWRYQQEKPTHVYLDYRLVVSRFNCFGSYSWPTDGAYSMDWRAAEFLQDIATIGCLLGFECDTNCDEVNGYRNKIWIPGVAREVKMLDGGVLFEIKCHKNGNMHLRLNQNFAKALNVEFGKLKGWIHSKEDAAEISPDAHKWYNARTVQTLPLLEFTGQ